MYTCAIFECIFTLEGCALITKQTFLKIKQIRNLFLLLFFWDSKKYTEKLPAKHKK